MIAWPCPLVKGTATSDLFLVDGVFGSPGNRRHRATPRKSKFEKEKLEPSNAHREGGEARQGLVRIEGSGPATPAHRARSGQDPIDKSGPAAPANRQQTSEDDPRGISFPSRHD